MGLVKIKLKPQIDMIGSDVTDSISKPKISVVTATYNYVDYVARAIESVANQTLANDLYEHIIVDDGSSDGTRAVVRTYSDDVRFIDKGSTGAWNSMNLGIRKSQGDYVVILDADDYFESNILERMYSVFEGNSGVSFVYSDYMELLPDGSERYVDVSDNIFRTVTVGTMYRKEQMVEFGLYDEDMISPEYDLLMKFLKSGLEGYHVPDAMFTYDRQHESLTSNTEYKARAENQLEEKYNCEINLRDF